MLIQVFPFALRVSTSRMSVIVQSSTTNRQRKEDKGAYVRGFVKSFEHLPDEPLAVWHVNRLASQLE